MAEEAPSASTPPRPDQKPVPVVAIGGSAGGQRAMGELLENLPADTGLAYVYIQHLSPNQDSKLDVILATSTTMPVLQATHLMPVRPDHLYVIPPGKAMEVVDGVLVLTPRKPSPRPHLPVDQFFISLAERQKDGAIGIVLSGMASDGTLGLKAIKVAGGITIAQDETADHSGMPHSAIAEGVVDLVLPPSEIAQELVRLSGRGDLFRLTAETAEISQDDTDRDDLDEILRFVKSATGVDFSHYKKTTIKRRIIRRMLLYKVETLGDYIAYLNQNPAEADMLYSDFLINVTDFFRDAPAMEYLKTHILPRIIQGKTDAVRIWVAGCSTGQEAYSLAIMVTEVLEERVGNVPVQIFATDLSESAIARARLGIFTKSEVAAVSPPRLSRFFSRTDGHYRVNKQVRDLCVFAPHNLLRDPPFSRIDLVSCRNLLIYLDEELQKKAFTTFHYALQAGGYLLLGKSESVGSSPMLFSQVEKAHKVFARKNSASAKIPLDTSFSTPPTPPRSRLATGKTNEMVSVGDLDKLVDNLLLSTYVPASVVIDQDLEIIQFRGSTAPFLQHGSGKASLNLTKMAHPSLVFELRNIVHKARKTAKPARKNGLEIPRPEKPLYVNIEAVPITNPANQQLFLVLFEPVVESMSMPGEVDADQRNQQLEAELTALRQDMHSIVEEQEASNEELQSANEEIVSSNEELQSINEELETSKEEIESANEELQTINHELQVRNDQLTESYEYSEAILSTINEATLVLDEQLRVRSANSAFYRSFAMDPLQTEGRLVYELGSRQFDSAGFRGLLHQVAVLGVTVQGIEEDIQISASEQRTMVIHARRLVLHRKQTLLLGFEDITGHRKVQQLLQQRQQWFEELIDQAPALIWVCQNDGRISFLNKAWVSYTGKALEESGATFYQAMHPDDLEPYQEVFAQNLGQKKEFSTEYRLRRSDGEYRWILENARPLYTSDGEFNGFTGSGTDIHLQKTLTEQLNQRVDEKTAELKQANGELEQIADRLQSVLNGVPASVTLMQPVYADDGPVIDFSVSVFNDKALEMSGQNSKQMLNKTLLKTHPDPKKTGLWDLYIQVLQTGEPAYREFTGLRSEGQTLAYLVTRQVDGTGIVVTALDISARKQAELKLTEVAESLQAVLNSSPASIAFFKGIHAKTGRLVDFELVVCNQKFSSGFEKKVDELVGMRASRLLPAQRRQQMKEAYVQVQPIYEEHQQGERWLAASYSRHDHGIAITELDITLLKDGEVQQEKLIRQLEGSNEMVQSLAAMREYVQHRGAFLRTSFHDLRGSFGIIVGAATLLNMMDTQEERDKVLDMIQRNLTQVSQMMNQLLDYSRLEAGEEKLHCEPFNAGGLLAELCEGFTEQAEKKGLRLNSEGPVPLAVEGDPVKVRRIAQNLILNALKYTVQGEVTVRWRFLEREQDTTPRWEFVISDTGPGLPERLLSKMNPSPGSSLAADSGDHPTEPNTDGHGEGIGLFIVKRLCELLEVSMQVSSEAASGTTFRIVVPQSYPS